MKLVVSKNNSTVGEYDFTSEVLDLESQEFSCFIGRADTCLVQLNDQKISREHARLVYEKGIWKIIKSSAMGEVVVNGQPVGEKVLQSGDLIRIGDFTLAVHGPSPDIVKSAVDNTIDQLEEQNEVGGESTSLEESSDLSEQENQSEEEGESEFATESNPEEELQEDFSDGEYGDEYNDNEYGDEYSDNYGESVDEGEYGLTTGDEGFDGDKTSVFSGFTRVYLELFGENIPFSKYELKDGETLIGRDPSKCQIVLTDNEVSAVHAKITKTAVRCTLTDMDSANGILLNGAKIDSADLSVEDEFIIGSTTFTYSVDSSFFKEAADSLMPVEENQVVEVEEVVEVSEDDPEFEELEAAAESATMSSGGGLFTKEALKDPVRRKKLLYIIVGLLVLWVLLDDEQPKKKAPSKEKSKDYKLAKEKKKKNSKKDGKKEIKLTQEQKEYLEAIYQVAQERLAENAYQEAIIELDKIFSITPEYKQAKTIYEVAKNGLAKLEELERKKQEKLEAEIRTQKVRKLVIKAKDAVKNHQVELAQALFNQILELDPENFDVPQLKIELDAWIKEKERKELEKAQKEAERKRKLSQFSPARALFIQKKWHEAIIELNKFLQIKDMDEDLIKEATEMLDKARANLDNIVSPMLGRARSLKEGQDLKGAYEVYKKILDFSPTNKEALKEMNDIKETLTLRARRVYRKALIAESLSLFQEAKELYQEVQQISPSDSEYYQKATERLKEFWEE